MAFEDYDDYEQSERVRQWLRENVLSIVVGVGLGLLLIFGWQQWRTHQARHNLQAAQQYQALQQALANKDQASADRAIDALRQNFDDTFYAVFATAARAEKQVSDGQLGQAHQSLAWAKAHAGDAGLEALMNLRLARVELAQGKAKQALARLDEGKSQDYPGLRAELRGDALLAMGRRDDARNAYNKALAAYQPTAPQHGWVQLKLDNLAVAGKRKPS